MKTEASPKFRNKNGTLTAYAFACGYLETREKNGVKVTLERDSACWHVKTWDSVEKVRRAWESVTLLTDARKEFRRQCKTFL
jgi:hypothetical protein